MAGCGYGACPVNLICQHVVPTVKFGVGGVMVWSCFSWRVPAQLVVLCGTITAQANIDVLSTFLLSTVEEQFRDGNYIFQYDLAPVHNPRPVAEWFHDNNIPIMDWPEQSPYANPIEHLRVVLQRRLHSRPHRQTSVLFLSAALREEWADISQETFQHLIEDMPARVEVAIKAKGGTIPYRIPALPMEGATNFRRLSARCLDAFDHIVYVLGSIGRRSS